MLISDTISIHPVESDDETVTCFDCVGSIDAHAAPVLDALRSTPTHQRVLLDFKQIVRVNSMGLSLLLKLFEEWEVKGIKIEVQNLNRMVSMLFKITGLGRFVLGADKKGAKKLSSGRGQAADAPVSPAAPFHAGAAKSEAPASEKNKLNFVASLQTGQQLSGWYLFNTFLQRRLHRAIHLEQAQVGQDVANDSTDLFFAKPFEACSVIHKRGFLPLMRPLCEADEVVILQRSDDARTLAEIATPKVVTATKGSFVYLLGRFLCDENGVDSSAFEYLVSGNEIKALQMVIRQQADLLFMLKKTYQGLSSFSRDKIRLVDESETDFAFHLFCVAPYLQDIQATLSEILQAMKEDQQGQQILKDIQFEGWIKPEKGELDMLNMVYERYVD